MTAQQFEKRWWGDACWTYGEETKQLTYARLMGLRWYEDQGRWPVYDLAGSRVLDIGGGPVSMLLKTTGGREKRVVDPLPIPTWCKARYRAHGIVYDRAPAEGYRAEGTPRRFDEAWIYNCLQHVRDPEAVIATARRHAPILRLFEWIDIPAHEGHPHELSERQLAMWLGGDRRAGGRSEWLNENGCVGHAYFGVFRLD